MALLSAILVLFNLMLRISSDKKVHFLINSLVLLLMLCAIVAILVSGYSGTFMNVFSISPYSLYFAGMFTLALLLVNCIAINYSENYQDFAILSNFSLLGMYMVAGALSLITIFIGLELASIPMIFAILLSRKGIEAAAKLFVMAAIAISVFSFATVMVYGSTNSFALASYPQSAILAFAGLLFIAALGFEASIFPFNVFIPDVYTGSSAYVTGMLGGINKKVGFAALIQILILIFISNHKLFLVVAFLSVITMFYGNIVALMQKNFKRMLAYSSISQAGYILIGIAASTVQGITASLFQIFAHMFIFIGIMAIVSMLENKNRNDVDELIGLNTENRYVAFALTVFMLSLIGLPFTTGFVGKLLLFLSAINNHLAWLAMIGIINTVISIFYYARAIIAMYTSKAGGRPVILGSTIMLAVTVCLAITIIFGTYPEPIISLANSAAVFLSR